MMPGGEKCQGGEIVIKQWISIWALIAVVSGCTLPGIPGNTRFAQQLGSQQLASPAGQQQDVSFTERVVNYLTPGRPASNHEQPRQAVQVNPAYKKLDPISLGYNSGPPNADLYLSMAQMSDRGGNPAHARSMYHKTLTIDAKNREALLGLARLEDREGNLVAAIQVYQKALSMNPQDATVLNDLALCHARKGELRHSANALETAIRLQPQKQLYRNNIAKVLVEMNHINPALNHLSSVHPPAIAQYNIGVLLHQRARSNEAVHHLAKASQLDPQLVAAQYLLVQINGKTKQVYPVNGSVLPTPMAPPGFAVGQTYPTTGIGTLAPVPFPAETAQVPLGSSPVLLPAVH